MATKTKTVQIPAHFHYREDGDFVRLHSAGDPGDMFDVLPVEDFSVLNRYMRRLLVNITDDDDNESCYLCHPRT